MTIEELARAIRRLLSESPLIEIDGLGTFVREGDQICFRGSHQPRIFIAYACEDLPWAERLYNVLTRRGFDAWFDRRKLLPGQNWPRRIEDAIANSDFFIACFSSRSVNKRGAFQAEIRFALDCARRLPLDEVFFVPVRLDECRVPVRVQREIQYVDLFPDWRRGIERVIRIIDSRERKAA